MILIFSAAWGAPVNIAAAPAPQPPRCGTVDLAQWASTQMPGAAERWLHDFSHGSRVARHRGLLPPPGTALEARDPYAVTNVHESDHFAIRWGSEGDVNTNDVAVFSEMFEASHDILIDTLGYPWPNGPYKFNVYIGDTGSDGIPPLPGTINYTWVDSEEWPMIVIDAEYFRDDDYVSMFPPHELFHGIQFGTETMIDLVGIDHRVLWYMEASAHWSVREVTPENTYHDIFIIPFAYYPELSISHWSQEQPGALRQYGAFSFIRHLTDRVVDRQLVHDSWVTATVGELPLDRIDRYLVDNGTTLDDEFLLFTAHVATWDHVQGDSFREWIDGDLGWGDNHRPTAVVAGASGEWLAPDDHLPHTYGSNYWQLTDLPKDLTISFEGDEGPQRWYAAFAQRTGDDHTRLALEMIGNNGELTLTDVPSADESWLVVTALDGHVDYGESFSYRLRLVDDEGQTDTATPQSPREGGCGCNSAASTAPLLSLLFGLTALTRRRRR